MPRYVALLRGVSPSNCKMPALIVAFEKAGFTDVKTVLSSGNVVFTAPKTSEATLEKKCEAAMEKALGRKFDTFVRSVESLQKVLAATPWKIYRPAKAAKQVVSFLRTEPDATLAFPVSRDGAVIHGARGREVFSSYTTSPKGPVFMALLRKAFGDAVTTRTWGTLQKLVK